jgi:hypothetical protein
VNESCGISTGRTKPDIGTIHDPPRASIGARGLHRRYGFKELAPPEKRMEKVE